MTSQQKQAIYDLLKTASADVYGYETEQFSRPVTFSDDEVKAKAEVSQEHKESLKSKISQCTRCPLSQNRINSVYGKGVEHPAVLVIADIPGNEEESQNSPVAGKTGILLDKELIAIGLSTDKNCYITNIVKCKSPSKSASVAEAESCISFLDAQIASLKPKMLMVVSDFAAKVLLRTSDASSVKGKFLEYKSLPLLVTYNPEDLIKNESLKRPAWEDLKQFKSKLVTIAPDYDK